MRKGQSLIETIIALSLLTVSFLGIFSLLSKSFFYDRVISDQTKGTYLAEEGIEIVKSLIDHDVYQGIANNGGIPNWGACFAGLGVNFDLEMDYTTVNCSTLSGMKFVPPGRTLFFNPTTGLYSYSNSGGALATTFTRDIHISVNGKEITVNSIVSWSSGPFTAQNINLEDHFYQWHP